MTNVTGEKEYDKWVALQKALRSPGMGFDVSDGLLAVARVLCLQPMLLRQLYQAYWQREAFYENKPFIGARVRIDFDWQARTAKLERQEQISELDTERFLRFIGVIDVCCSEIYPIGTVAELDVQMLPQQVQTMFEGSELVSLVGRKLAVSAADGYVMDYVAWLWPFGHLAGSDPITVSNMMIHRVVASGLCNDWEERFAVEVLRRRQVERLTLSTAFMPEELLSQFGIVLPQ